MVEDYEIEVLYKYRSIKDKEAEYTKRIFTHNEVYFSRPIDFNDPFDCQPRFILDATDDEIKKYLNDRYPTFYPELTRQQRRHQIRQMVKNGIIANPNLVANLENAHKERIMENTGVFCLSEIPDQLLMWSHYASSHTGLCIEFEATNQTPFFSSAHRVHYQTDYPIVNIIKDTKEESMRKALLTKSKDWGYEKEWRIHGMNNPPGVYNFPNGLLKGVILGARIKEDDKQMVLSWIGKMNYRPVIYQAKLKKHEYGIDIMPL